MRFAIRVAAIRIVFRENPMSSLVPMSSAFFPHFGRGAIESYARQNVASGRCLPNPPRGEGGV